MTADENLESIGIQFCTLHRSNGPLLGSCRGRLLVGLQDFQPLAGLQRVAPFFYFVRRTRCRFQAIVKLAVTGFDHCLVQVALGKIAGEIVCGQGRRQSARLLHRPFATFFGWFGHRGIRVTRRAAAQKTHEEECDQGDYATQKMYPLNTKKNRTSLLIRCISGEAANSRPARNY
jgi:hypothetical protein